MKPYYELDQETKNIVLELLSKCNELDLGNINFQYFYTSKTPYDVFFYLTEYKSYWQLVVKREKETDIYKINDNIITYDYSESD